MNLKFAWRYFRGKKSANAINIIAWVTVTVIAFATGCQVLVLSVFNGFEGLVKSLYSSFYPDIKITPEKGKSFLLNTEKIAQLKKLKSVNALSLVVEEKALLKNEDEQTLVFIKGVDTAFARVSGVTEKITSGKYNIGDADNPKIITGIGIQNAIDFRTDTVFGIDELTLIAPQKTNSVNPMSMEGMSEGVIEAAGVFAIQQEFDNQYAITNIDFLKQQMAFSANEYSAVELKLNPGVNEPTAIESLKQTLGNGFVVKNRFQQNASLYMTMQLEKWAIFAVLTLILIIAAFNMVSALTMLVLEKQKDISLLQALGTPPSGIRKIFLSEGILLSVIGAATGIGLALIICYLQLKFHLIKLVGGTFLIDYFPVQVKFSDIILVILSALLIAVIASWFPASKASARPVNLR